VVQIGGAMGQVSKATAQNASASEELAATSEELSGQAEQLQHSVSYFKTGEDAQSQRTRAATGGSERRTGVPRLTNQITPVPVRAAVRRSAALPSANTSGRKFESAVS
ncbi:MAG: hypothetical protein ACR2I0_14285, partial [Rhodoferax sp.]